MSLLVKLCLKLLLLSLCKLLLWSLRLLRLLLLRQCQYGHMLSRLLLRLKELLLSSLLRLLLLSGSLRLIVSSKDVLLEEGESLVVSEGVSWGAKHRGLRPGGAGRGRRGRRGRGGSRRRGRSWGWGLRAG